MAARGSLVLRVAFLAGVALIATAALVTWGRWPQSAGRPDAGTIPDATAPRPPVAPTPTTPEATRSTGRMTPIGHRRPVALHIPSLRIDAKVVPVSVGQDGALGVPDDPSRVGWWAKGPAPGDPTGTAVIDGHVDSAATGPGALFHLRDIKVGAEVVVDAQGGPIHFRIAATREYAKASLPWQKIFDQSVRGRLVIVTCGGEFNSQTRNYLDNIVAYAVPTVQ